MTDRRNEGTPQVPSVASIVTGLALLGWAILTTVYVALGLDDGTLGTLLGVVLSLVLLGQVYGRIIGRGSPRVDRMLADGLDPEDEDELAPVADQFGPHGRPHDHVPFVPAWNQHTSVVNRVPTQPRIYEDVRCEPVTERLTITDPATQVLRVHGVWPPRVPGTPRYWDEPDN